MAKTAPSKTFEQALSELEALVKRMEAGQIPLKELVECYASGAKLVELCEQELKHAELKILEVKNNGTSQPPVIEVFKES